MCNSYCNYPRYCCTSPASQYYHRTRSCCIQNCCHHCKPPLEPLCAKDVVDIDQSEKNKGRKMCPGLRNETIKNVLTRSKPVCPNPFKLNLEFPLLASFNDKGELLEASDGSGMYSAGSGGSEDDADARFIKKLHENLHTNSPAECKRVKAKQNQKFDELTKEMNTWYVKEMKEARNREFNKYYMPGASINLGKKTHIRKHNALGLPNVDSATFFGPVIYIPAADDAFVSVDEETHDFVDIEVADTYRPLSTIQQDDDTLTIAEMRALLQEVKSNPKRPLLFHPPFDRNNIWSWKNYDPLTDTPSSLKKTQQQKSKRQTKEYSLWTMNIVHDLLKGDPVTDKKLKTNKELRKVVQELAHEIRRRQTRTEELLPSAAAKRRSFAKKHRNSKHSVS